MSTIPLNDALRAQKFDNVSLYTANIDEVTTAPGTIYLGNVKLENDFSGYLTLGDYNGGVLSKVSTGDVYNMATMTRDNAQIFGDPHTNLYLAFSSDLQAIMSPCFQSGAIIIRAGDTVPGTPTTTTIGGTTVYELSYDTGTFGFNINVYDTTWDFAYPSTFRVIITELSSGVKTFDPIPDDEFLAGGGFTVPSIGKQAWTAVVPALLLKGLSYNIKIQSLSSNFNLNGALYSGDWKAYTSLTGKIFDTKYVPCLPIWQAGTWSAGDQVFYVSDSHLDGTTPYWVGNIYTCNETGAQTGTFADNIANGKWSKLYDHTAMYARRNSLNQTITKLTDTPVVFDTENTANELYASRVGITYSGGVFTNTSGAGRMVNISYNFVYEPNNVGDRWAWVRLNGQNGRRLCFSSASSINNVPIGCVGSFNLYMANGDYFEVMTRHSSNINLALNGSSAGIDAGYSTRISIARLS